MALWICSSCGFEKKTRCRPGRCPECGACREEFIKV